MLILMVFMETVAIESMGGKTFGFSGGRADIWSPPEDIYLEMLSQALVDNELVEDEITLLETFRGAYGISDEIHQRLLNLAMQEPVYSDNIKTYNLTLETALNDGIITPDEEAMLVTLRESLGISDRQHANLLAKFRDSIK